MKLLIIGHSVADIIISDKVQSVKPGGIAYSIAGLKSFISNEDEVVLCTSVDDKFEHIFTQVYSGLQSKFIQKIKSMPVVELKIKSVGEREEKYSNIPDNLSLEGIDFKYFDGVYINMVSGFDISIQQMKEIRNNFDGLIYFDVHTFSRGVNSDNKRIFRKISDFKEWVKCIDILQANESELKTLSDETDEEDIARELLDAGIKQIIITRGEKGSTVFFNVDSHLTSISENAINVVANNKVGCGDVFGLLYFYRYISTKNISISQRVACTASGLTTTYNSIKDYMNLKRDVQLRHYKE